MKMSYIKGFLFAVFSVMFMCSAKTYAQAYYDKIQFSAGWQANAPVGTDYTDNLDCWGMNFEINYNLDESWTVGGFFNFSTNHSYVGRKTLQLSGTESLTTDQLRSLFQLPFGLGVSYKIWNNRILQPYVGAKLGASFAKATTYYGTGGLYDKQWGFYVAPEIGAKIYPFKNQRFGVLVAGYYSYSTNRLGTLTHDIDGLNNAGFRIGLLF